ncbi:unnamed protein product [Paramecium sonneborni]|uniref:Uncharacterized protein n=1 Tax=Paramecium sonneborni TaxID=65129 RepID=A0A8S1PHZ3_9CILI|nr:unnamed protein product [Paramecium sonneborni]
MAIPILFQSNSYLKYSYQHIILKAVINSIVKLCKSKQNLEYRQCLKEQNKYRYDFRDKLNDYFNNQQQQLYERMKQQCMNKNDEELIQCFMDSKIDQKEINNKMQEFKEQRRKITKNLI